MKNITKNLFKRKNGHCDNEGALSASDNIIAIDVDPTNNHIGDINQIGYKKAGRHNGDSLALKNSLELIKSGQIVDENNNKNKIAQIRASIDQKINEKRKVSNELNSEMSELFEVRILNIDNDIKELNNEINELEENGIQDKARRNRFNHFLYWIVFVPSTIYLFLFYVSAVHSAIFRNIAIEVANTDQNSIGILFNTVFDTSAYNEFHMHWFAPVIFFVFGILLHISLESNSKMKWIQIIGIISFVFIADGMLAFCIERNNQLIKELIGLGETDWKFYRSIGFYLVLFFGFFTSIGWSVILHKLAGEYATSNFSRKINEEIQHLNKRIRQLRYEKGELSSLLIHKKGELANLVNEMGELEEQKKKVQFCLVDLEKSVDGFYNGWLSYLNGLSDNSELKVLCENIFRKFKETNFNIDISEKKIPL